MGLGCVNLNLINAKISVPVLPMHPPSKPLMPARGATKSFAQTGVLAKPSPAWSDCGFKNRIRLIIDGAGRGRKYTRVVIDNAGHAWHLKDIWEKAILPTLTDYSGSARIISWLAPPTYRR